MVFVQIRISETKMSSLSSVAPLLRWCTISPNFELLLIKLSNYIINCFLWWLRSPWSFSSSLVCSIPLSHQNPNSMVFWWISENFMHSSQFIKIKFSLKKNSFWSQNFNSISPLFHWIELKKNFDPFWSECKFSRNNHIQQTCTSSCNCFRWTWLVNLKKKCFPNNIPDNRSYKWCDWEA
jgi:hypothetical protein